MADKPTLIVAGYGDVSKKIITGRRATMKAAMVICQETPEVIWNAFRLANMMLEGMEDVSVFLNGPSVKFEESDSEQFP